MRASLPRKTSSSISTRWCPSTTPGQSTSPIEHNGSSFGTSGHRGSSLLGSFNEPHILAITQAICDYRRREGTSGPLYLGKDTHALSEPASRTALEVLAANGVDVAIDDRDGWTPTPRHLVRDPQTQRRPDVAARRRHHPDAVTQSAGRRRPEIQPADRRAGRDGRHPMDRAAGQPPALERSGRRRPHELREEPRRRHDSRVRLRRLLRRRSERCRRHGRHSKCRPSHRRRSARRRGRRAVAADCRTVRARDRRGERRRRSDVRLHASRSRRPHPHGLLVAVRDGQPHQAQGPVRYRHRQRPGRRSARHRHAGAAA